MIKYHDQLDMVKGHIIDSFVEGPNYQIKG